MKTLKNLLEFPLEKTQAGLAASRSPISKADFVDRAGKTEKGRKVAGFVWEKLDVLKVVSQFSPDPADDLLRVYGLAEEDLDEDIILESLRAAGLRTPTQEEVKRAGPINTPADIVKLAEYQL